MTDIDTVQSLTAPEITAMATASTIEVFATMLNLDLISTGIESDTTHPMLAMNGTSVVSLIGLTGPWSGTGSVTCSGEFACLLASRFLCAEYPSVNDEVLDAMGELTNMIIGNVKTGMEERLGPMSLSTPAVIFGQIFQTYSARIHDWLVLGFLCGAERLQIRLCLAPSRPPQPEVFRFPGT